MHWWRCVRQFPPEQPAFQEKPAWAPREWSWLETLRHSRVQVKSKSTREQRDELQSSLHRSAEVQGNNHCTLARGGAHSTAAERGMHTSKCMPPRKCPYPGDEATSLLCLREIGLTLRECSPPGLPGWWTVQPMAGLQCRWWGTQLTHYIPSQVQ